MNMEIRRLGPGKFGTVVDEYVWLSSLDGCCDVVSFHWGESFTRTDAPLVADGFDLPELNPAETAYLESKVGAIIHETNQGFVFVTYFDSMDELDVEWSGIEAQLEELK